MKEKFVFLFLTFSFKKLNVFFTQKQRLVNSTLQSSLKPMLFVFFWKSGRRKKSVKYKSIFRLSFFSFLNSQSKKVTQKTLFWDFFLIFKSHKNLKAFLFLTKKSAGPKEWVSKSFNVFIDH